MKELLKDQLKQSMVLAALFAFGLVWLLFALYSLPAQLGAKIYILTPVVFGMGIAAFFLAVNSKKENVVFA